MAIQTATVALALSPVITLKGRGKAQREVAYMQIAPAAMIETQSRGDLIGYLRTALGASPSENETRAAQIETVIGRVAARLPVAEFPKGTGDDDSKRLDFARLIVMHYAAPAVEGKKARPLRKGQQGRRTVTQHKVIRAADEYWSQVKAELGLGAAKTQAERNAAKRAPSAAGSGKGKAGSKGAATPTHSELVTPAKPLTADEAAAFVTSQAATLLAYANKHAKLLPTPFGAAIQAFKSAINTAANDYAVAKAARDAVKADNAK